MDKGNKLVDDLVVMLGADDLYLCMMYDDEYDIYIAEVLDKYGELQYAGLGNSLENCLDDLQEAMMEW